MKNIIYIAALLMLISCEKQVKNFEFNQYEPSIVINGLLNPDSIVKVHITQSISGLDRDEEKKVENLVAKIYKDGDLLANLTPMVDNYFIAENIYPIVGGKYEIRASGKGLEDVICRLSIPKKPHMEIMNDPYPYEMEIIGNDTIYNPIQEISIKVDDPENEENYYMISMTNATYEYIWDEKNNWPPLDSVYIYRYVNMTSKDRYIEVADNNFDTYKPSFDEEAYGYRFFFSDDLFNGHSHTFNFRDLYFGYTKYRVVLTSISRDYYELMKDLVIYTDDPFENMFIEKVSVYSNVENGIGVVAGINNCIEEFDFSNVEMPKYPDINVRYK